MGPDKRMNDKRRGTRCKGKTAAGKSCRAAATESGLCFFHSNPNKAAELGRIGGRKNRHPGVPTGDPPLSIETAKQVMDMGARLLNDVYFGKLSPRVGAGMAPLLNLQLRAIEATDLESRISRLEARLLEIESSPNSASNGAYAENPDPERMPIR
jgi:hypothetical protein